MSQNNDGGYDDDKRQRQMDFILEQQAQFTVDIQLLRESDAELRRTLDAFIDQSATQFKQVAEQFEQSNERHARNERAIYSLIETQERTSLDVQNLTTVVDRIADAVAFLLEQRKGEGNGA